MTITNFKLDFRNGLSLPQPVRDAIRTVRKEFTSTTEGEVIDVAMSIAVSALSYEFGTTPETIAERIAEELHAKRREQDDKARDSLMQQNISATDVIPMNVRRIM